MNVAIHLGAHCTDASRLLKTLVRNRDLLSALGIVAPEPFEYRYLVRDALDILRGEPASEDIQNEILDASGCGAATGRLILSNPNFISMSSRALEFGQIYPRIAKAEWLRNVFCGHPVEFFLAIRNPATFVPAIFEQGDTPVERFPEFSSVVEPEILRWSDTVIALREACPDCPVTVWCHEDTPLFWDTIIRRVSDVGNSIPLSGGFDMLRPVMTTEGMNRLRTYTRNQPPGTETARRKVMTAFLDKFADPDAVEETFDLPGWTPAVVSRLSEIYENDVAEIARLDGVTMLMD